MKLILLFALCLLYITPCFSQIKKDNVFLVGTSSVIPKGYVGIFDGFGRIDIEKERFDKDDPISFRIGNPKIEYTVVLYHYNLYNKNRPDLYVENIRIADLKSEVYPSVEIINIDEFFAGKTKMEVWRWMLYHHLSKTYIWVVDYNSAYKSSEKLSKPDMIKVVQVRIFVDNIPEEFRRSYYSTYNALYGKND